MSEEKPDTVWLDKTITFSVDNASYSADPRKLLMAMARAQRDGMSLKNLRAEYQLPTHAVSDFEIQRALAKGHIWLNEAIAKGEEPGESKILIDRYSRPLSPDETDEDD